MKFSIKHFHNKFSRKLYETWFVFHKRFGKSWDRFLERGHEKMTVMFIPHNEKRIFNFQISRFIVFFFLSLFLVVVVTSSYAVIKNRKVKQEEQKLLHSYNDVRANLIRYEKLTNEIYDLLDDLKPEIEDLYSLAAGTDQIGNIWENREFELEKEKKEKGKDNAKNLRRILPREIFEIRDVQKDLVSTTRTIKMIKNFINVRSRVIKDTPSIIPNPGHISSLFGWRRSPFGYGRDFHTGIDIAAPAGTVIRATAPGVVVTSGWMGGYGNAVRIKHKFGYETIYGHMRQTAISKGAHVRKGDRIGYVGMTGNSTGNHCHYEIRLGGIPINPYPYMSRMW